MRRRVGRARPTEQKTPVEPTLADRNVRWDQEFAPALPVEPRDCPAEALHVRINIGRYFEVAMACGIYPSLSHTEAAKTMRRNPKYKRWCAYHGVNRQHTGLRGDDVRTILNRPHGWLRFMEAETEKELEFEANLLETMRTFAVLDRDLSALASGEDAADVAARAAWGVRALAWVTDFMTWFEPARGWVYLHIYATHLYRWPRVVANSTHAMEKVQAMLKYEKHMVRRDPKTIGNTKGPSGALQRILDRRNANPMLAAYLPAPQQLTSRIVRCSACHSLGHTRRSLLCRKVPVGTATRRASSASARRARAARFSRPSSSTSDTTIVSSLSSSSRRPKAHGWSGFLAAQLLPSSSPAKATAAHDRADRWERARRHARRHARRRRAATPPRCPCIPPDSEHAPHGHRTCAAAPACGAALRQGVECRNAGAPAPPTAMAAATMPPRHDDGDAGPRTASALAMPPAPAPPLPHALQPSRWAWGVGARTWASSSGAPTAMAASTVPLPRRW